MKFMKFCSKFKKKSSSMTKILKLCKKPQLEGFEPQDSF